MALRTRVLPVALVAGLVATGAAGCGSSGKKVPVPGSAGGTAAGVAQAGTGGAGDSKAKDPQSALSEGLVALGKQQALDVVVKLAASPDDLIALDTSSGTNKPLTADQAKLFTGGDFELISKSTNGAAIADAKGAVNTAFLVHTDGSPLFEVRTIGGTALYARADVDKILTLSKTPRSKIDQQLASVPPQYAFVKDAANGKWLKVDIAALKGLTSQLGGAAIPSVDPTQAAAISGALIDALKKDVGAARGADSDKGDHLVLTTNSRALFTDVVSTFSKVVPGGAAALNSLKPQSVPDKTITMDAYLKGGTLSEVSLELTQFVSPADMAKLGGKRLPLDMVFKGQAPDVTAPTEATTVDVQGLLAGVLGGLKGGSGGTLAPVPTAVPLPTSHATP